MTDTGKALTTGEYSKLTGISVSSITRMLRQGTLKGEKRGGKWVIDAGEVQESPTAAGKTGTGPIHSADPIVKPAPAVEATDDRVYDVDTFVRLTYLTEKGVRQWIKSGRLSGSIDASGKVSVDAANLERPELRHLIRT